MLKINKTTVNEVQQYNNQTSRPIGAGVGLGFGWGEVQGGMVFF